MQDVVVVGGGPAGSASARLLAKDHDVTVLEEHAVTGVPMECTGLVSPDVLEMSGVRPTVYNTFSKAVFHFPDGGTFPIDCRKPTAILIDRAEFDVKLAQSAMDAGARFEYSKRCTGYYREKGLGKVLTEDGTYEAKVVVGADGASSRIRSSVCSYVPDMWVRGLQADIRAEADQQDTIDIYMGSEMAPGFFGWSIPFGEFTRIGLCCEWSYGAPSQYLAFMLRKLGFEGCAVVSKNAGKIPLGHIRQSYFDNTLLIGDSACQVKPISGGGLAPIMKAAPHLASAVERAFSADDFSASALSSYQTGWDRELRTEIKRGFKLRSAYNKMSDKDLNKIRRIVDKPFVRDIALTADIDRPSEVCVKILRHPLTLMRLLPLIMKGVF